MTRSARRAPDPGACQVRTGQMKTGQVKTGRVRTGQVKTGQVRTGQVRTGQVRTGQVRGATARAAASRTMTHDAARRASSSGLSSPSAVIGTIRPSPKVMLPSTRTARRRMFL